MTKILTFLISIIISYVVAFIVSWATIASWILFWEYGWVWNAVTVPPMVWWNIFFTNVLLISIIALFPTPIFLVIIMAQID